MLCEEFKKFIKSVKERNRDNKEILAVIEDMEKDPQLEQMIGEDEKSPKTRGESK